MMDQISQYLISVVAAAIISSIAITLISKKSAHGTVVKLLVGIFMSITVVSPLTSFRLSDIGTYLESAEYSAESVANNGSEVAFQEMSVIISEQTQAYILDKASSLGLQLEVDVTLTESTPPVPHAAILMGDASPYAKMRLQQLITNDLGISEDNVIWK